MSRNLNRYPRIHWIVYLLLILFLTSCSPEEKRADFIWINGPEPQTLDPTRITGQIEGRLAKMLFEGLLRRDAKGALEPGAAESWNISPDGLHYTFYLRENLKWSDGTAITAEDFVRSWQRALQPETATRYVDLFFWIRNAEEYATGKLDDFSKVGIYATDARTLHIELKNPTPFFLELIAFVTYLPVPTHTIEKYGSAWVKPEYILSNGPYLLKEWRLRDRLIFEKNSHYWDSKNVLLTRAEALTVTTATTAFNLYATGEADMILDRTHVPAMLLEELKKRPDFHTNPFLATYFYRFNTTRPPFNDPHIRKAFALALDKTRIVTRITKAGEPVASSLVPPNMPGYTPPRGLEHNPARARELLEEAGYKDGKKFPRISILYNKTDLNEQIATEIQAMWHETLGVHVELKNQEWASYLQSLDSLDFDIARSSWVADYADPYTFLDCFATGRGNNRTGWSHPAYDTLLNESMRELEPSKRMELLRQAETILVEEELPILPIYFFVGILFYDANKFSGIEPNPVDEHPIRTIYSKNQLETKGN